MSNPRTYFLLIFLPYLFLVVIFHLQLQIVPSPLRPRDVDGDRSLADSNSNGAAVADPGLDKESFHFRDLMLKDSNSELYAARGEYEKAFLGGPKASRHGDDGGEPYHQVAAPKKEDESAAKFIKVSRTFQNGTRQVRDMIRLLDADSQRLQLDGASDLVGFGRDPLLRTHSGSKNHSNHVHAPLTDACRRRLEETDEERDEAGGFHYVGGVHIASAYLDARLPDQPAFVRLISLMSRGRKPGVYCHFPHGRPTNGSAPLYDTQMPLYYEMCENHNKEYGGWIISCQVPSAYAHRGAEPCHVVVSESATYGGGDGGVRIPIYATRPPEGVRSGRELNFGICVPPLFGHIPSTTLVEFVELSRLLGSSHLIFYIHQVTSAIQKVLEYYQDRGVATVIGWELPVRDKDIWYHGQLLAINDCLYRTMHRFSHVVFNDVDEFLVPHVHDTWHALIRFLERPGPAADNDTQSCGYSFQSAFFDPLVNGNGKILYDLESDLRTKTFSRVRTKVMARPQRIFELGIHHISRPLLEAYAKETVEPGVAFIHHYRKCMMDFDPRMKCQVYARDESVSRYIPSLRHNVHQTLWILKELDRIDRRALVK